MIGGDQDAPADEPEQTEEAPPANTAEDQGLSILDETPTTGPQD